VPYKHLSRTSVLLCSQTIASMLASGETKDEDLVARSIIVDQEGIRLADLLGETVAKCTYFQSLASCPPL
jgi:hypothetical protein